MEGEIDPMADLGFVNDKMIVMEPQGSITPSLPAKDLCARFIPHGEKLYELLYAYDMITSLVLNTGNGDGCVTKYVAPFLKAFGATDYLVSDFFAKNIPISANAADFLRYTNDIMPVYLNSCMYEQAADAICGRIGEPMDRMISVCLPLDETEMPPEEARSLRKMADILSNLRVPDGPFYGTAPLGLSRDEVQVVSSLDKIFKGGLSRTASDRLMENVG
jgi:energy-converting hydrogenase A subunit R